MGGHGGLNILPQKRWNVYNRDNRLKVAQDEAKAKKQEDEARERHEQAEREHRHQLLLRHAAAGNHTRGDSPERGEPSAVHLEHINFWKEEEAKLQHPENEKQQRDELKRRGNPDFYTSDAKFDERFALAYGLVGEKPWYAQALKPEDRATGPAAVAAAAGLPAGIPTQPGVHTQPLLCGPKAARPDRSRQIVDPHHHHHQQQQQQPGKRRHRKGKGYGSSSDDETDQSSASTSTSSSTSESSTDSDSGSTTSGSTRTSSSSTSDSSSDDSGGRRKRRRRSSRSPSRERSNSRGSKHRRKRRRRSPSDDDSSGSSGKKRKHRRSERSKSRTKSRSKSKSKSKSKSTSRTKRDDRKLLSSTAGAPASKSIEQLRGERLQREKEERIKQRGLLAKTAVLPDGPPEKDYNSAFGFAAALKRKRK